jgi:large subunit ribosomal protein L22
MADYMAESKNVKISPRKVRLVAEGVKHMDIKTVLAQLSVLNMRAATPIKKTVESAIANAVNNAKVAKDNLMVKEITVNEGILYKRYHYAARGRIRPYKKRTSHIRVVLTEKAPVVVEKKTEEPVKKEENGSES